jgi:hypothetical protein
MPMTYPNDPNLDRPDPPVQDGMGWGIPLAVAAAVVLVAGLLFFNMGSDRTTTASNNAPVTTQSTSAPNAQSTPSPQVGQTAPPPAKSQ